MVYIGLLVSLAIILFSAEIFTNGIEWLGKKLNLSEGAVGSVLAAVGTALPETMIPVIAILFNKGTDAAHIGIGAILGAPFMLATLAMSITGIAALTFKQRGSSRRNSMLCDFSIIGRDLGFFILVYSLALSAAFISSFFIKQIIVLILVLSYLIYVFKTLKAGMGVGSLNIHPLTFNKKNPQPTLLIVLVQIFIALGGIVFGAQLFVSNVSSLALMLGIPAFVLSIIIAPIATELPEKFNSIVWIRQGKDTLALGNITGAMVFQSSLIPALGISLTSWELSPLALISGILALMSATIIYSHIKVKGTIKPITLVFVGLFYLIFLALVLIMKG